MKTIVVALVMFLFIFQLSAQTKDDYSSKSKKQKITARTLLIGGGTLIVVGGIIGTQGFVKLLSGEPEKADNNLGAAGILDIISGAAMLGSILFFIASRKNKHKGMSIALNAQHMPALMQHITGRTFIPSIILKISI